MRVVIVIGASGYLGSKVVEVLKKGDYQIYATQNNKQLHNIDTSNIIRNGIKGLSSKVIKEINPDAIFHCGRPTYSRLRKLGRHLAALKAAKLNKYLLEQISKSNINVPLFFASGSLSYGSSNHAHNEDSTLNPISYSRQYLKGEIPLLKAVTKPSYNISILRFPWLLGNDSWFEWFYLKNIKELNKIPLFGDGTNHMSIINVKNAASLMVGYFENGIRTGYYNIYSPEVFTQMDFLDLIRTRYNCEIVDYKELYPDGLEASALEAFQSNIILNSNNKEILNKFKFTNIKESLDSF